MYVASVYYITCRLLLSLISHSSTNTVSARASADEERYMINAQIFSGANSGGAFYYYCKVKTSDDTVMCPYGADGVSPFWSSLHKLRRMN